MLMALHKHGLKLTGSVLLVLLWARSQPVLAVEVSAVFEEVRGKCWYNFKPSDYAAGARYATVATCSAIWPGVEVFSMQPGTHCTEDDPKAIPSTGTGCVKETGQITKYSCSAPQSWIFSGFADTWDEELDWMALHYAYNPTGNTPNEIDWCVSA